MFLNLNVFPAQSEAEFGETVGNLFRYGSCSIELGVNLFKLYGRLVPPSRELA